MPAIEFLYLSFEVPYDSQSISDWDFYKCKCKFYITADIFLKNDEFYTNLFIYYFQYSERNFLYNIPNTPNAYIIIKNLYTCYDIITRSLNFLILLIKWLTNF